MKKFVCFLMVGLAFTVLQVSTVAAQTGAPVLTIGDPACATVPPAAGCPAGSPGMMGDPNMPPPTGAPGGPPMGDPSGMPPTGALGAPPKGDATAKPSLGERVKSFFGMDTKDATPPTGAPVLTIGDPACATVPPAAGCPAGSPGMMGDPNMPPPTGAAGK